MLRRFNLVFNHPTCIIVCYNENINIVMFNLNFK